MWKVYFLCLFRNEGINGVCGKLSRFTRKNIKGRGGEEMEWKRIDIINKLINQIGRNTDEQTDSQLLINNQQSEKNFGPKFTHL